MDQDVHQLVSHPHRVVAAPSTGADGPSVSELVVALALAEYELRYGECSHTRRLALARQQELLRQALDSADLPMTGAPGPATRTRVTVGSVQRARPGHRKGTRARRIA